MSLSIRHTTYRDAPGFLLCGRPLGSAQRVQIFCRTRALAAVIRLCYMRPGIAMYAPGPIPRMRFWFAVVDGLLLAERRP